MPGPGDLLAQIQSRGSDEGGGGRSAGGGPPAGLMAALQAKQAKGPAAGDKKSNLTTKGKGVTTSAASPPSVEIPEGKLFIYDEALEAFLFSFQEQDTSPAWIDDVHGNNNTDLLVPLAPCVYRMTDYTLAKKEPILISRCVNKLGVLRCLARECRNLNRLLWHRLNPAGNTTTTLPQFSKLWDDDNDDDGKNDDKQKSSERENVLFQGGSIEEDELSKARFMELLSNCGVYQKVSELLLQKAAKVADQVAEDWKSGKVKTDNKNPYRVPQIQVKGLDELLEQIERFVPELKQARDEILNTQSVSFYPGLGELFVPGSKLLCYPEGMEGTPVGCSCVQSWYAEDINKATNTVKRRFVLVNKYF